MCQVRWEERCPESFRSLAWALDGQQRCHFLRWENMRLQKGDQEFLLNFQVHKLNLRFLTIPFQLPELRLFK